MFSLPKRLKSSQQYMSEYSSAMNDANKFKNRILNALPCKLYYFVAIISYIIITEYYR